MLATATATHGSYKTHPPPPPLRPPPELIRIREYLMGGNIRAAQVLDQDLCLLGVALLNVLQGLLVAVAGGGEGAPVGQGLEEAGDVLVFGPLGRDDALVLGIGLHEAAVGRPTDLLEKKEKKNIERNYYQKKTREKRGSSSSCPPAPPAQQRTIFYTVPCRYCMNTLHIKVRKWWE